MVAQHEYQHNETILQTLQLKRGEPYRAPRGLAVPRAASSTSHVGVDGALPWRRRSDRHGRSARRVRQRASAPPRASCGRSASTSRRSPTGSISSSWRTAGISRRELWSDAGWAWKEADSADSPKYWSREGSTWHWRERSIERARWTHDGPCATSPITRPRRTRGGRASGCLTNSSGRPRRRSIRRPGEQRLFPWGNDAVDAGACEPRPADVRDRAGRRVSAQRVAVRLLRHDRRRLGMDVERLPRLSRLRDVPVRGVLGGLLRQRTTRCCAAVRSPRARVPSATRSATGTTLFAARSSAASGAHPMTSIAGRPDADAPHRDCVRDVAWGLSRPQKELPPKYFYDRRGSELFDEITRLPEYYLTRTERALLDCWSSAAHGGVASARARRARRRQRRQDAAVCSTPWSTRRAARCTCRSTSARSSSRMPRAGCATSIRR